MYTAEEFVEQFQMLSKSALDAKDKFGMTKDWYLKALASSEGMTHLEYTACIDELDRRMNEIAKLEKEMSAIPLTDRTPDSVLMGVLEKGEAIVRRLVEMQQWLLAEGDRLELPR